MILINEPKYELQQISYSPSNLVPKYFEFFFAIFKFVLFDLTWLPSVLVTNPVQFATSVELATLIELATLVVLTTSIEFLPVAVL